MKLRIYLLFILVCISLQSQKNTLKLKKSKYPESYFEKSCSNACKEGKYNCGSKLAEKVELVKDFFPTNYNNQAKELLNKEKGNSEKQKYLKQLIAMTTESFKRFNEYKFEISDLAIDFCYQCCSMISSCTNSMKESTEETEVWIKQYSPFCFTDVQDIYSIQEKIENYKQTLRALNEEWNAILGEEKSKVFDLPSLENKNVEITIFHKYYHKKLIAITDEDVASNLAP